MGSSVAEGVSADGSVVVGVSAGPSGSEAFRWTESSGMAGLGDLPGGLFLSGASGVSADGSVVVGSSWSAAARREAFRWTAEDGMVGLGFGGGMPGTSAASAASADGSVLVGQFHTPAGITEAFRWTSTDGMVGLGDLAGGATDSTALSVSPDGSVVVGRSSVQSGDEAFRWTAAGGMEGLGNLPDASFVYSIAIDVSADGSVIVGQGSDAQLNYRAFLWDESHGMRLLQDVLENDYGLDLTGWTLGTPISGIGGAWGVSADGRTIVGTGLNPSGQAEAWIAVLPEPSLTWLLGLAVLASWRRHRI
jgi:probable HAF family extracellular repeat protein